MKVYAMDVSGINPDDAKWTRYLSKKRIEKVKRLKKPINKAQSIGVELLMNFAVNGDITRPVKWDTDERGKPFLTERDGLYVSLSHSGSYAAIAVGDVPVGVDIQRRGKCDMRVADRFFTAEEAEFINGSGDKADAFFEIWTKKESLVKTVGKGLAMPLNSFSVLKNTVECDGGLYKFVKYRVKASEYKLFACYLS